MAKTFKFKSDEEIVKKASDIFEKLGLSLDQAVSIFLRQSILQNGIPFRLVLPDGQNEIPEGVKQEKAARQQRTKQRRQSPSFAASSRQEAKAARRFRTTDSHQK